jgi:hypothetical protein
LFLRKEYVMAKRTEVPAGVFAPKASRQESRADATTTVARSILQAEVKARDAKTAKLKALRLAQEEAEAAAAADAAPVKTKAKAKPKAAKAAVAK